MRLGRRWTSPSPDFAITLSSIHHCELLSTPPANSGASAARQMHKIREEYQLKLNNIEGRVRKEVEDNLKKRTGKLYKQIEDINNEELAKQEAAEEEEAAAEEGSEDVAS